eukprot:jgi/Psemu1/48106/gm1.48106_g
MPFEPTLMKTQSSHLNSLSPIGDPKTNGDLTSSCKPTPETHHLPTSSRVQFANLLQRQYTTPKAASPDAPILAPITPAEAKNVNATIPSDTTKIEATNVNATIPSDTTKMVGSNAVATPVTALSGTPANFRRTFTLQSQSVVFHRLPKPVSGITKRHRDALKIKMYHLYANILLMNWFYDTFD